MKSSLIKKLFFPVSILSIFVGIGFGWDYVSKNEEKPKMELIEDLNGDGFQDMRVEKDTLYSHFNKYSKSIEYNSSK